MNIDKKRVKVLTLREEKAKDEATNEGGGGEEIVVSRGSGSIPRG